MLFIFRKRNRFIFLLSALILNNAAQAARQTEDVLCPSLHLIHQSAHKIENADLVNGHYIATTLPYAIRTKSIGWFAVVYGIQAGSVDEAKIIAVKTMQNTQTQDNIYARNLGGTFLCGYDRDKINVLSND